MSNDNIWIKTAQYVSDRGTKKVIRDDPFAYAAEFTLQQDGFDYSVKAHASPYSMHGQTFTLTVKEGKRVVCKYSYPGETATISKGDKWQRQ